MPRLDRLRKTLLARRRERPPVRRDDKVIAAWNGLMIRALARGGSILHRDEYVAAAEKAAAASKMVKNDAEWSGSDFVKQSDALSKG